MSSRRGISYCLRPDIRLGELGEQVRGVVRTGAGFGMVLDAERGHAARPRNPSTAPSFRFTWVTSAPPGTASSSIDVVVVLARDLDAPRGLVAHRMVRAVVPEEQLARLRAERAARGSGGRGRCRTPAPSPSSARDRRRRRRAPPSGSPGPFERNTPSGSRASTSAAASSTRARPRPGSRHATRWRRIVRLIPKSYATTRERRVGVADDVRLARW